MYMITFHEIHSQAWCELELFVTFQSSHTYQETVILCFVGTQ